MTNAALKTRILTALGHGMITGIAAVGCTTNNDSTIRDAATDARVDDTTRDASVTVIDASAPPDATVPGTCYSNSVGRCCTDTACLSPSDARRGAIASAGWLDSEDGGVEAACPNRVQRGFCDFYADPSINEAGECCYTRTSGTCCGRPFVVTGETRSASAAHRGDWLAELAPTMAPLSAAMQKALTEAWLADAHLEHASIAAFARFTLHALSLGAPSELLAAAQLAASDEVEHARLCYALASRYARQPLGPSALPTHGLLMATTLAEAAADSVREGCVGETLAALQVRAQLAVASDPAAHAALTRIADDEARHAELAWRFVRWACQTGGAEVQHAVAAAFRDALAQLRAAPLSDPAPLDLATWHAHGRLSPAEQHASWLATARDLIEPCAEALLSA